MSVALAFLLALGAHIGARPRIVLPTRGPFVSRVSQRVGQIRCSTETDVGSGPPAPSSKRKVTYTEEKGKDLPLAAKERMFIESIAAFYNDDAPMLSDDDYARLKLDLEFEASKYVTMSSDELKFVIASQRYREGSPIMDDAAYDELRKRLKAQNSAAVIHEAPTCKVRRASRRSRPVPDAAQSCLLSSDGRHAARSLELPTPTPLRRAPCRPSAHCAGGHGRVQV
jgi:hypothetical protein